MINKIHFTFLLIFSLSLLGDPYAPLNFPSYNPFTLKFIHFDNRTLGNYRETNHLSVSVENSSYAVKEIINNDQLTLDGEIAKASINYFRKLSDNLNKAMGSSAEIDRYKHVFGVGKQKSFDIVV